jgi:hypothetical protein
MLLFRLALSIKENMIDWLGIRTLMCPNEVSGTTPNNLNVIGSRKAKGLNMDRIV